MVPFRPGVKILNFIGGVNRKLISGRTPLHLAVGKNRLDMVKEMLSLKAYINQRGEIGYSAAFVAVTDEKYYELLKFMLENGADLKLDGGPYNNKTLLHLAAAGEANEKIMKLLLDFKIPIDSLNSINQTPLFYSIGHNRFSNFQFLVNNGAKLDIFDNNNLSPLDFAIKRKEKRMIDYLFNQQIPNKIQIGEVKMFSQSTQIEGQKSVGVIAKISNLFHKKIQHLVLNVSFLNKKGEVIDTINENNFLASNKIAERVNRFETNFSLELS